MTVLLALLLAGLALALLALALVLRAARGRAQRKQAASAPASEEKAAAAQRDGAARHLGEVARQAFSTLTAVMPETPERYETPLVLLAGDSSSGKTTLLKHSGLANAAPIEGSDELTWHNFNQGIVLEVGASYLGLDNQPGEAVPAWGELTASMQRYRPRRPLDAVVLTVGVDLLRGPDDVLDRHAGQVQRRLAEMQVQFGLRLPIYLMITKADLLADFAPFVAALPPALRTGMLGWSNPHDTGAPFDPAWVGAAFGTVDDTLSRLTDEIMAGKSPTDGVPGFFALAPAIAALRQSVLGYVSRLMGAQAHAQPVMLRGIYLCGDQRADAARPAPAFVRDFMASKVLAERGIAEALRGQMFSRDRSVRFWRTSTALLVAVWLPALALDNWRLDRVTDQLLGTLEMINKDASWRESVHKGKGHLSYAWYHDASNKIVAGMLSDSSLVSYAIPFSWHWFDPVGLDKAIDERFKRGIASVLLPTIRKGFNLRVHELTGTVLDDTTTDLTDPGVCKYEPVGLDGKFEPNASIAELDAFKSLDLYVDDIAVLGFRLKQFKELQESNGGSLQDLAELGKYTGAFALPETQSGGDAAYLRRALKELQLKQPLAPTWFYAPAIACGLDARHEALLQVLFDRHPLRTLAGNVDAQLHGSGVPVGYDRLQADLHEMKLWLAAPGTAWLHARRAGIDKPYTDLLGKLAVSEWAGKDPVAVLQRKTAARLDELDRHLQTASDPSTPILQRSADAARLEMSPPVAKMEQALSALMAQPFMAVPPVASSRAEGRTVMWDLNGLNRLLVMAGEQQAYLTQSLGTFPVSIQAELKQFADQRLAANLSHGIGAAQSPASDPMAAWVRLGQAQKLLSALLENLDRLGASPERQELAAALAQQAVAALAGIDAAFEQEGIYLPKDGGFEWWTGSKNPAAQGFAGGDPAALDDYLAAQHELVERSARLTRPLLRLYQDSGGAPNAALVRRWSAIGRELERFADKAPGGRIAALHAYIRNDLAGMDQQNCGPGAIPAPAAAAADFFAARTRELGQRIALRCTELTRSGGSSAYATLAAAFRGELANRFPFAPAHDLGGMAADPDDVAAFLQAYDKLGPQAQLLLSRTGAGDGHPASRARKFMTAAERVRAFLAPLLPLEPGEEAGYDLRVRFRVNDRGESDGNNALSGEVDGNRIVEWTLQVGDQTLRFRNGEQGEAAPLRWRIGMPVKLVLRWADNAPSLPRADQADPHMRVVGREVRYEFGEPWSLLRMLGSYRVASARGETLRLDVPLGAGAASAVPAARVFLRLALTPANKKTPLAFPVFPFEAPTLDGTVMARARTVPSAGMLATGGSR